MSDEPVILTERRGHVLIVTINRPGVKNAFNRAAAEAMEAAMDLLDQTDELFLAIITGAGGTFCAGQDLRAAAQGERSRTDRRGGFGLLGRPSRKPLIAAVEGFAYGGGFEICLACDLVVAAETARFALPEVKHNLLALGGGLFRLPRKLPHNLAVEMTLTGRPQDAAFLHRWGVVNRVTPEGGALAGALELAEVILDNGPTAVAASKEVIYQAASWATEEEAWRGQEAIAAPALASEDFAEGLRAFGEKRKPVWKGR